ncbi:MAG: MGMT family protein [Saccharofermentanales bacterium]|jgi:methylated-DNA-protein-cysteine methyltransferase-like protein
MSTFDLIYEIVRKIPEGKVASYGQIAALAGNYRWARVVGYALHACPGGSDIPCHRVVTKDGRVSTAFANWNPDIQRSMLESEGVKFRDDKVIMTEYQWRL